MGIVLMLSASSGTKESEVVAGSDAQSDMMGSENVGVRNSESLITAGSSSKPLIGCSKLISSFK